MSASWSEVVTALRRAGVLLSCDPGDPVVSGIAADSRTVSRGDVFLAVPGTATDGHRFVADAVARGASGLVVERRPDGTGDVPQAVVEDGRKAARVVAEMWYGHPAERLQLIGVTGTNGKTTTTALLRHLLNVSATVGSVGTLGAFDGTGKAVPSTAGTLTTPGPVDLQATLAAMVAAGVDTVVMETSSHSLDQGRLDGLVFAAGLFTNLTRDHLDYHESMEAYQAAKLRLTDYLGLDGVAIVNRDDEAWAALSAPRVVSFGHAPSVDVRIGNVHCSTEGSRFELSGHYGTRVVELPLLGAFNVDNAVAAAATALAMGETLAVVAGRLAAAPQIPGRMERISDTPCPVLRDYAHTPDALERALQALRPLVRGRLIAVFGCGGDRDRGKRPLMGRIAEEWADLSVMTSDNPRTEDPEAILDDVERGMTGDDFIRVADRREAISRALEAAEPDDTVLLAGKGHETYQVIGHERQPFDEVAIVRALTGP